MGFLRGPKLGKRRNSILRKSFRWRWSFESCLSTTEGRWVIVRGQELRNKRLELSVRIKPKEGSFCEGDIEIKRNSGKAATKFLRKDRTLDSGEDKTSKGTRSSASHVGDTSKMRNAEIATEWRGVRRFLQELRAGISRGDSRRELIRIPAEWSRKGLNYTGRENAKSIFLRSFSQW